MNLSNQITKRRGQGSTGQTPRFIVRLSLLLVLCFLFLASPASAQTESMLIPDTVEIVKAEVVSVISEEKMLIPGTDVEGVFQTIDAKILEGSKKGETIRLTDDLLKLKKGDKFYLNHTIHSSGDLETYTAIDADRLPTLLLLAIIFVLLVLVIGGVQGFRGLLSLIGSFFLILFVLLPAILKGYSPLLVSIVVSSIIIILGSYITHGFNRTTTSAVLGMITTVLITGALAYVAVHMGRFTGYGSDEVFFLNLNSRGSIDILGLLLGGIMIGLLGVLYDVAIGQAVSVEELHHIAPHVKRNKIYSRAIRMGREHIGALVDTLAIAYVGASLPLLLLFYQSETSALQIINREIVSSEIIRILIGSIGLVLAVPITTLIAVLMLVKKRGNANTEVLQKEFEALEHAKHHH